MANNDIMTVGKLIELLKEFDHECTLVRWSSEYYPYGKYVPVTTNEISLVYADSAEQSVSIYVAVD